MNILYTNFHPRNGGGHASYVANLAQALHRQHNITVATPGTSRLYRQVSQMPGVKAVDTVFSTRAGAMWVELKKLRALIRAGKFDLIHVNGSADHRQVMLATKCMSRKPKIIWTKHNTMPVKSFGNSLRARFGTDAAIGVSDFVSNILRNSAFAHLPIKTIYHGIDTDTFKPSIIADKKQLRHSLLGPDADDVLLMASVGGTDRDKGWLDLAAAIAALPSELRCKIKLLVAGDHIKGGLLNDFQALNVADNVIFPGLVDKPQDVLAAADIGFVLSWHEAFSFAAAESLSCGLPTLVSDAGGLPEVVRNGTDGWVVPAKNQSRLFEWLNHIIKYGWDTNMSIAARDRAVDSFSLAVFAKNTMDFYQQICNRAI